MLFTTLRTDDKNFSIVRTAVSRTSIARRGPTKGLPPALIITPPPPSRAWALHPAAAPQAKRACNGGADARQKQCLGFVADCLQSQPFIIACTSLLPAKKPPNATPGLPLPPTRCPPPATRSATTACAAIAQVKEKGRERAEERAVIALRQCASAPFNSVTFLQWKTGWRGSSRRLPS